MRHIVVKLVIVVCCILASFGIWAEEYTASLAEMPVHAISETEGIQVNLIREIEKITGHHITIKVYPFARSIYNIIENRVDFHAPLIKNDIIPEEKLPYYYSTETIYHVNFVLYTLKGSKVTLDNLSQYKVETDRAHVDFFPFQIIPSNAIVQSLKKLNAGRIDAYIFADSAADPVLRELGYTTIERRLYKRFESKMILPKTDRGKQVDDMLSSAIRKLRESGKLQKIVESVDLPYDNWQP